MRSEHPCLMFTGSCILDEPEHVLRREHLEVRHRARHLDQPDKTNRLTVVGVGCSTRQVLPLDERPTHAPRRRAPQSVPTVN